jgi:hypothetical protein
MRDLQFADSCESQGTENAGRRTDNSSDGDFDERGTIPSRCSRQRGVQEHSYT